MIGGRVAVILASVDPDTPTRAASLDGFAREVAGRGELILVGDRTPRPTDDPPGLRRVDAPAGRLVPELWGDGLRAADAEFVAFSTTQMVPSAGWLDGLLGRLVDSDAWGVGGMIAEADGLGPVDRAVYLQRFLAYRPGGPIPARPAGENALYRRHLLGEREGRAEGFWEAEVQARLERSGGTWAMAPDAIVTFVGPTGLRAIAGQRVRHAHRYGALRAGLWSRPARWARALAAPIVPAVLLARAGRGLRARRMPLGPWLAATPSFLVIASAWATGEALGAMAGRPRP